jgi:hypothetical protein
MESDILAGERGGRPGGRDWVAGGAAGGEPAAEATSYPENGRDSTDRLDRDERATSERIATHQAECQLASDQIRYDTRAQIIKTLSWAMTIIVVVLCVTTLLYMRPEFLAR